jgi:hypothetical protein
LSEVLSEYPLLKEFAEWLQKEEWLDESEVKALLTEEWSEAYPEEFVGDDLLTDISNFIYFMGRFAVEKATGKSSLSFPNFRIVPDPSYEDCSTVYVLDMENRKVVAEGVGHPTWDFDPETIASDIEDMIEQIKQYV